MNYIPRLWHAIILFLLGCAALWLSLSGWPLIAGIGLILMAAFVLILLWRDSMNEYYRTITAFGNMLAKLTPDQWSALGIAFPHIRIRWKGKPIKFFEDTSATMEDWERFLDDSNWKQISPERNWKGADLRKWEQIKGWLEEHNFIIRDSAAGQHSWLWRGNMYSILRDRYLYPEGIPDLAELEQSPSPSGLVSPI